MDALLKFLNDLIVNGDVDAFWVYGAIATSGLGVLIFYIVKSILMVITHFKGASPPVTKDELISVKDSLQDDNKYILKLLEDLNGRLKSIESSNDTVIELNRQLENEVEKVVKLSDEIKTHQAEGVRNNVVVQRDLTSLVTDSKVQYVEITRQVQALQVDLASLHGTIIGLNSQRTRLK